MSKEVHFCHPKFAFLKLDIQFFFPQPLEHLSEVLHVLLHWATIDQNVIYVYDDEIIKPFSKNVIHENA
jgi:hypothetical protein